MILAGEVVNVTISVGGNVGVNGEAEMSGLVITMSGTVGEVVASGLVEVEFLDYAFIKAEISSGFSMGETNFDIGALSGI